MAKRFVRVVVVTALQLERTAVLRHLGGERIDRHPRGTIYSRGTFTTGAAEFDVLVVETGAGNSPAAVETERAVAHFNPAVVSFVGICGGIKDVALADVVAADTVLNYESAKAKDQLEPRPTAASSSYALVKLAREVSRAGVWVRHVIGEPGGGERPPPPRSFVGPIAAGEKVVASVESGAYQHIRQSYGHCLAVAMEEFGFLRAAYQNPGVEALVVRAVSDLIEGKTAADKGGSQPRAAAHAAAFAFEVLRLYGGDGDGGGVPWTPLPVPPEGAGTLPPSTQHIRQILRDGSKSLLGWPTTVRGGHRISTSAEQTIRRVLAAEQSATVLLLGPKGAGKSALSAATANEALREGMAVLGIRADKLPADLRTDEDLRRWLRLPVSVGDAIRSVAAEQKVVLLVDQLDSVSELTDRRSERLNLLLNLISELRGTPNVAVVAACREFDYQHDARLGNIQATEVRLELPAWEAVAPVLQAEGHNPDAVGPATREILRTPWHLGMYLKVARPGEAFASLQALLEAVWRTTVTNADGPTGRAELLERVAERMSKHEELVVPATEGDDAPEARDALLREGVLVLEADGRALAFRHQTYYDHALTRSFARGASSLAARVLAGQDGLFVRPTMLSGLEYLRATARNTYRHELRRILDAKPRRHIRTLVLEFLGQQRDPDDAEAAIFLPLLETDEAPLVLRAAAGSPGWFVRLGLSDAFGRWMARPPDAAALCVGLLARALETDSEGVYLLVSRYWAAAERYDQLTLAVAQHVPVWNKGWNELLCRAARRSDVSVMWHAQSVAAKQPSLAALLVRAQLDRELREAERAAAALPAHPDGDDDVRHRLNRMINSPLARLVAGDRNDRYGLEEVAAAAPQAFLDAVWPWFVDAVGRTADRPSREGRYREDNATYSAYSVSVNPLIQALHGAADELARRSPDDFVRFAARAADADLLAVHRVLCQGFAEAAPLRPEDTLAYLAADARRLMVGTHENELRFSEKVLTALAPNLAAPLRAKLEQLLTAFDPYAGAFTDWKPEDRFRARKWSRRYRLRLLRAVPDAYLSDAAKALKAQEEALLPGTGNYDSKTGGGWVGPRVTREELGKASDRDVLNLINTLRDREERGADGRLDWGFERGGGTRQQAGEFGALAGTDPERAIRLLASLQPGPDDAYAAAVLDGLSKSQVSTQRLLHLIEELDARGFRTEEVRERAAAAVEHRASQTDVIPDQMIRRLEGWLATTTSPRWPEDEGAVETTPRQGPIVFRRGGGGFFSLLHGRGAIFRAICAACFRRDTVDAATPLRVLRARVGREEHAKLYAEMLWHALPCFQDDPREPSAVYDAVIRDCPGLLRYGWATEALAALAGAVQPPELYEGWLSLLSRDESDWCQQAFGELLFLCYARKRTAWADDLITTSLGSAHPAVLTGLAYGAAETWHCANCRGRATDVLCVAASSDREPLQQVVESAFTGPDADRFAVDADAKRLIETVCENPPALRRVASQLLDALAPSAGTRPELVYAVARRVLSVAGAELNQMSSLLNEGAAALTNIAVTLHRHPDYREPGLQLFEELLRLGVREAAAALDLIDRKPYQPPLMIRFRRPRRQRRPG